jgi:hypothetical protein
MAGREQDVRNMGLHMRHGQAIALLEHRHQAAQQSVVRMVHKAQIGSKRFPGQRGKLSRQ